MREELKKKIRNPQIYVIGLVIFILSSLFTLINSILWTSLNSQGYYFIEYSLRRIRGEVIPERYQRIVAQLNHPDWKKRIEAIEAITSIII
ncbi:MAG: hypothetical protein NC834_00905, partial [Candidatus Omnitrophica bacterium]|nr:hypothetical protein [Candidatus Omnitrophota bacterium]